MYNLPKDIKQAAQRIAALSGETVEAVIQRFSAAVKKSAFTRDDFLFGYGLDA